MAKQDARVAGGGLAGHASMLASLWHILLSKKLLAISSAAINIFVRLFYALGKYSKISAKSLARI